MRATLVLTLAACAAAQAAEPPRPPGGPPDVRAIVRQRGKAIAKLQTIEQYLPGLARRTGRLLNPFPLRTTLKDALSFVLFVPSAIFYPLRRHVGSGVVIDAEGHLLTNDHVVRGADRLTVRLTDREGIKRKLAGTLLARDPHTDIALVKIDPKQAPLVPAPIGDSHTVELGDWVVAIGQPLNLTGSVTVGVVSGRHRRLGANLIEDYIQIDAAVNPGNSGGPILDSAGRIVGIVSLGLFPANNIGFAVPTSLITPFLDDLKARRRPRRGYLGVSLRDITPDLAEARKLDVDRGVLITRVRLFSPAADAGLRRGDIVLWVAGKQVAKARQVQMLVLRTRPGTTIPITVRRKGKSVTLKPTLRPRRQPFRIL